jgi:DNA-binding transcriptional MerR regulator
MNATSGTTRITYTIGGFSTITGLSIKTLRFCHAKDILVPSSVDTGSGYR